MPKKIWAKNEETGEMVQVDTADIAMTPPVHNALPDELVERIKAFKEILKEVETMSLEQTLYNFRCDRHPEREVLVWEGIARNYASFLKDNPNLTLQEKHMVYQILFERTLTGAS